MVINYLNFCLVCGYQLNVVIELVEVVVKDVYKCFLGLVIEWEVCVKLIEGVSVWVIKVFG